MPRSKNSSPKKIVCLGDSITCNWEQKSYPEYWQELVNKDKLNYQVVNAGINGETAQDGYYRLGRDVISHEPELVTVMFGHNEVLRGIDLTQWQIYTLHIVTYVKHVLPKTALWLLSPNQVADRQTAIKYVPLLAALAQPDPRFRYINVWDLFSHRDLDKIYTYQFDNAFLSGRDFIHPNAYGQKIIARYLHGTLIDAK